LLLLRWNDNKENGNCPAKIYEYFGFKRPILAIGGPEDDVIRMLNMTNSGEFANNSMDLQELILKYYNEFLNYGEVKYHGNNKIDNFTYYSIAKKYSDLLNSIAG